MKELGIRSIIRRKKPYYGTNEIYAISDNLLNRQFHAAHPQEKWVTDITYLPCGHMSRKEVMGILPRSHRPINISYLD